MGECGEVDSFDIDGVTSSHPVNIETGCLNHDFNKIYKITMIVLILFYLVNLVKIVVQDKIVYEFSKKI